MCWKIELTESFDSVWSDWSGQRTKKRQNAKLKKKNTNPINCLSYLRDNYLHLFILFFVLSIKYPVSLFLLHVSVFHPQEKICEYERPWNDTHIKSRVWLIGIVRYIRKIRGRVKTSCVTFAHVFISTDREHHCSIVNPICFISLLDVTVTKGLAMCRNAICIHHTYSQIAARTAYSYISHILFTYIRIQQPMVSHVLRSAADMVYS